MAHHVYKKFPKWLEQKKLKLIIWLITLNQSPVKLNSGYNKSVEKGGAPFGSKKGASVKVGLFLRG